MRPTVIHIPLGAHVPAGLHVPVSPVNFLFVFYYSILSRNRVSGKPGAIHIEVWEVNRPDRAKRRLQGKSDPTDAESAARTVLSGNATATPKSQSGVAEALRMLSVVRRSAVKARQGYKPSINSDRY